MYTKHTFQSTNGIAVTKGKRIFIDQILASHIDYPFAANNEHTIQYEGVAMVEVFNDNGRRFNGISAFSTEFELLFSGEDATAEELQETQPSRETKIEEEEELDLNATYPFISLEDLRLKVRSATRQRQGEMPHTLFSGTVTVGKMRQQGKGKEVLAAELLLQNATVTAVKNKWLFMQIGEVEYFAKTVRGGSFSFLL